VLTRLFYVGSISKIALFLINLEIIKLF